MVNYKVAKKALKMIGILLVVLWFIRASTVYGFPDPVKTVQSKTMKEIIVPLLVPLIAFGGVAFSVMVTVNDNRYRQEGLLKEDHRNRMEEIQLKKSAILFESRMEWMTNYRESITHISRAIEGATSSIIQLFNSHNIILFEEETPEKVQKTNELRMKSLDVLNITRAVRFPVDKNRTFINPSRLIDNTTNEYKVHALMDSTYELLRESSQYISAEIDGNSLKERNSREDFDKLYQNHKQIMELFSYILKDEWDTIKQELKNSNI